MFTDNLFSGNALRPVDADGRTTLPSFVLRALERRGAGARLVLGTHPTDPCINGYDERYGAVLFAEVEALRLREESRNGAAALHSARLRRIFGGAATATFDARGRVVLPPPMRRRCGIGAQALFVGTGGSFEIWSADAARQAGGDALRELAELASFETTTGKESEVAR